MTVVGGAMRKGVDIMTEGVSKTGVLVTGTGGTSAAIKTCKTMLLAGVTEIGVASRIGGALKWVCLIGGTQTPVSLVTQRNCVWSQWSLISEDVETICRMSVRIPSHSDECNVVVSLRFKFSHQNV